MSSRSTAISSSSPRATSRQSSRPCDGRARTSSANWPNRPCNNSVTTNGCCWMDVWAAPPRWGPAARAAAPPPRAPGLTKSHGAQFLEGRGLERALTLPAGHRTSVFAVRGGHTRTEVYSWYVRLWPWEGNDLLYGLLRVEARADPETIAQAPFLSSWPYAERAPLAPPATRWDRLLYPLHHVEEYLKARAPRDLQSHRASRLPRTGT